MAFQPTLQELSTPLIDVTFCVLDLETTGVSPTNCAITEIGAVKYRGGELLGSFQTLVDPGSEIPPSITLLTGITHAMVIDAPTVAQVLPTFLEFIGDSVIVGHNVRFDLSFLNAAATRNGYERLSNKSSDTAALSRRLVHGEVRNLQLSSLAAHFRSPISPNHRALADAKATAHVFHSLLERAGSLGVTNLDDLLQLPTAKGSPHYGKISLAEHLPRSPGVYVFRDRSGTPIYIGKASDLRSRVRQYFYGDRRRSIRSLMSELATIDHQVCDTLLEAEVTELRLIHAHRPRYNRRSRPPKNSHFVKLTKERFPRLSVVRKIRDDGLAYLGPFRSKKSADLVVMAIWDALPIRRCRGRPGARSARCAPAQIGVASCPCDGTLDESEYARVVTRLLDGIATCPALLLEPVEEKMHALAREQRYEEAGWARSRHDALASTLELRHVWQSLNTAGLIQVETVDGARLSIDQGVLGGSFEFGALNAGLERGGQAQPHSEVPPSVEAAEEARVIWRFLTSAPLRLIDCDNGIALPASRAVRLRPTAA